MLAAPILLSPFLYTLHELNKMQDVRNKWLFYFVIFSFIIGYSISIYYVRKKDE